MPYMGKVCNATENCVQARVKTLTVFPNFSEGSCPGGFHRLYCARLCRFLSVILPVFTLTGTPVSGGGGSVDTAVFDSAQLLELIEMRMPFGKYKGTRLIDLPEPYVVWFAGQGFPPGKLGRLLGAVHEIKVNGLEYLFDPLRQF
jgi:hypothetical protein